MPPEYWESVRIISFKLISDTSDFKVDCISLDRQPMFIDVKMERVSDCSVYACKN